MIKYVAIIFLLLPVKLLFGQTQEEKIKQIEFEQELARNAELTRMIDQGVILMDDGQYEEANIKFKEVLKAAKVVSSDLTYYFGKNSFYLGKYKQSIDWLNKYIELKGTKGVHYEDCVSLLDKSNQAYMIVRDEERKEAQTVLTSSYEIDCGPTGKVVCPVCSGNGVIIQRGSFGDIYKTCPYSDEQGYLTCEEYNLLLKGELKPKF